MQIKITDQFSNGVGRCLDCGFTCQDQQDDQTLANYEMAINHAIDTGHRTTWRSTTVQEVLIVATENTDTVDLGQRSRINAE